MCGTPIINAAQLVNLPLKVLNRLKADSLIDDPVSDSDMRGLSMMADIWGKVWYIRSMLSPLPQAYRQKILLTPDMSGSERYALSCYLNAKQGERIRVKDIIDKVPYYLKAHLTERQVIKVRAIAYDIRRGRRLDPRKKGDHNLEIAKQ